MATLTAGSSVTLGMDAWASLTLVVSGKATLAFTSGAPNLMSDFNVSQAQSKTYGPFGVPMSVTIAAVDRSLTYSVAGQTGGFGYDDSGNVTSLVSVDGNVFFTRGAARPTALVVGNSIARQSIQTLQVSLATTYLASGSVAGSKVINLNTGGGATIANGDKVALVLVTGEWFKTTVASGGTTDTLTLTDALPKYMRNNVSFGLVQKYTTDQPFGLELGMGIIAAANSLIGAPLHLMQGYGIGGAGAVHILDPLEMWLRKTRPRVVIFGGLFENNFPATTTGPNSLAGMIATTKIAAQKCLIYGATPIFQGIVPCGSNYINSAASVAAWDGYNAYVAGQLWTDVPGAYGYSCNGWLADPTKASATQRLATLSYTAEASDVTGIHPAQDKRFTIALASNAAGAAITTQLSAILTAAGLNPDLTSVFSGSNSANYNLSGSGGTLIDSGGATATVNTGGVPSSVSVGGNNTGTALTIPAKNADGSFRLTGTFTSTTSASYGIIRVPLTAPTTTNILGPDPASMARRGVVKFRLNAATNINSIYPKISWNAGIEGYATGASTLTTAKDAALVGQTVTIDTADCPIPSDATTGQLDLIIQAQFGGVSASFDIDVYGMSVLSGVPHVIV